MDADCFERVARALTAGISRPALASAFVGSLGVLGLQRRVEATAKELCPPCKKRKKGTCKKNKPDGDACPGGTYRRGRCAAAPVALGRYGTGRAGGEICDGGTCRVAHRGEAGGRVPSSSPGPSTMRTSAACGRAGAKCQARADAVGLDCTYKAWLSTVDDSPKTRFVHAPGPYRLVDGTKIADDWADLTDGTLRQAIDLDEAGNRVPARTPTWTATNEDGTLIDAGHTCGGWITAETGFADMGATDRADTFWSSERRFPCASTGIRLYCFQQF
jgi:hypothetical protein